MKPMMVAYKLNGTFGTQFPFMTNSKMAMPMQVQNNQVPQEQSNVAPRKKSETTGQLSQAIGLKKSVEKVAGSIGHGENQSTDKTSQYLKVLSRMEGLLLNDALPEVAIQGFVGAVKKQLDKLTEAEKQAVLNLPEARALELKSLEELPGRIEKMLADTDEAPGILKLLKEQRFAGLMRTDEARKDSGTYTSNVVKSAKTSVPDSLDADVEKIQNMTTKSKALAATPKISATKTPKG